MPRDSVDGFRLPRLLADDLLCICESALLFLRIDQDLFRQSNNVIFRMGSYLSDSGYLRTSALHLASLIVSHDYYAFLGLFFAQETFHE